MHHVQQSITYAWQTATQIDLVEGKNIQSNHELDEFIRSGATSSSSQIAIEENQRILLMTSSLAPFITH